MLRVLFGMAIGVFLAQNYDVPDAKTCMSGVMIYLKEFEKNLGEKGKES